MKPTRKKSDAEILRQKAEDLLKIRKDKTHRVSTKPSYCSTDAEIQKLINELSFQNEEKGKRADELLIANKEMAFQNKEKEKRAEELSVIVAKTLKLTHELEVHHIELKMQNEELLLSKSAALEAAKKYSELYDFAPSGYFTLSGEGKIVELNFSGADMLGKERSLLKNSTFSFFVAEEAKPIFNLFLRKVFISKTKENCEVTLQTGTNQPLYVYLTGIAAENGDQCLVTMIDITRRKQMQEDLSMMTDRLSMAIRAGGVGVWEYDVINNVLSWDDRMFELYGINKNSFSGLFKTWQNKVHPDDKDRAERQLMLTINGGKEYDTEFRIVWPDGTIHHIRAIAVIHRDDLKKSLRLIGTNWDITKLRKSEKEKLDDSENRYRSVFQGSPDGIMITDEKTNMILYANRAQCQMLGYTEKELRTMNIAGILPQNTFNETLAEFDRIAHREKTVIKNFQCLKKSGESFHADVTLGFITISGRKCIVGFFRDITERRKAEEAMRESEEKYRTMLNASPDCMVLTNMNGIIMEVSEIGLHLLGADTRDDLVGRDIFQFVSRDEIGILREMLLKTTNEGFTQNLGITVRKQNQTEFIGEISATLMRSLDGAPLSFMILIRDISQRKKKEARQIHADRMSTLGEMAAGIAHEINQPLNIISMVLDNIIFETTRNEIIDEGFLKKKSDKIFENITRIRDIIDHVRAFSRSHDDYVLTAFNVNSSIVNASSMIMEQFKHQGINLNLLLEQQIPTLVGNTYKFEQVILNLLANAKDAVMEKKNMLEKGFEMLIGIRTYQESQHICVEITDNGIGIHKDDIHNVMLPFYTTKEEGKGTGLGLSISGQIIKEMDGTMELFSENMMGTKIILVLPVQRKKQ
jgi:PAS domain S-box-containing protein